MGNNRFPSTDPNFQESWRTYLTRIGADLDDVAKEIQTMFMYPPDRATMIYDMDKMIDKMRKVNESLERVVSELRNVNPIEDSSKLQVSGSIEHPATVDPDRDGK